MQRRLVTSRWDSFASEKVGGRLLHEECGNRHCLAEKKSRLGARGFVAMASYSLLEFLGTGSLKDMGGKLAEDGWDDVPTLKAIGAQDMEALDLTGVQRDALELRIYLHNCSLMKYADRLESSRLGLIDLIHMKPSDLASKFGMRKTHVAKFLDTTIGCGVHMPPDLVSSSSSAAATTSRRRRPRPPPTLAAEPPKSPEIQRRPLLVMKSPLPFALHKSILSDDSSFGGDSVQASPARKSNASHSSNIIQVPAFLMRPLDGGTKKTKKQQQQLLDGAAATKGVFTAAETSKSRGMCGFVVKAPAAAAAVDTKKESEVTKVSVLERVVVRQLAPDQRNGVEIEAMKGRRQGQPFQAAELWAHKATLFLCIRRPGCVMCRAEAHHLFARKPVFDALGIQLVAVLLEDLDEEVWAFWPRYWAGVVVLDEKREFFRALGGGGKLKKENFFTGILFNPMARFNFRRALKTGIAYNARGEGWIKGGMFIVRRGKGGVAYQFAEKNLGDCAPLEEVLQVCRIIKDEEDNYCY